MYKLCDQIKKSITHSAGLTKIKSQSSSMDRHTANVRMTQRDCTPKGASILPTTHMWLGKTLGIGWAHRFTSDRLVGTNPLVLSRCPFSLFDSSNPSQASIIVSYDCFLPRHPFTESPSSRARPGLPANTEPIRWFEENWAYAPRLVHTIFNNYFDTPRYFQRGFTATDVCRACAHPLGLYGYSSYVIGTNRGLWDLFGARFFLLVR